MLIVSNGELARTPLPPTLLLFSCALETGPKEIFVCVVRLGFKWLGFLIILKALLEVKK